MENISASTEAKSGGDDTTRSDVNVVDDQLQLIAAASAFDVKAIESLIAEEYDVNEQTADGDNAVHAMLRVFVTLSFEEKINIKPKFIEILMLMATHGLNINSVNRHKQTALHFIASQGDYSDVIKPLLAAGIRVNLADHKSMTALHLAIMRGFTGNVRVLLEGGADTNIGDTRSETPLHMLCKGMRSCPVPCLRTERAATHTTCTSSCMLRIFLIVCSVACR